MEKRVLRNFIKFTGKHLCQSLFFNKIARFWPEACNFIKKETLTQVFSSEFYEISKNTFSNRTPLRNGVVLVSLLLTLNIFYTLIYCFYC